MSPSGTSILQYDQSLFSLGIVLIGLWFGKRFIDLPEYLSIATKTASTSSTDNYHNTVYEASNLLIFKIENEAVPSCIAVLYAAVSEASITRPQAWMMMDLKTKYTPK